MQKNIDYGKSSTVISVIALVAILVFGLLAVSGFNKVKSDINDMPALPTNAEFKQMIKDEFATLDFPEYPDMPEFPDTSKIDNMWDVLFSECVSELEGNALSDAKDEMPRLDWSDLREYVEDSIENFDKFVRKEVTNHAFTLDKNEIEVTIVELGECPIGKHVFNEEGDKKATVVFEYDFEYEKDDSKKVYKDTLYVTVEVEYDEGNFDIPEDLDLEVTYSL